MNNEYMQKIQQWVEIDNKLLEVKENTGKLNESKKNLEQQIINYVETNKLDNIRVNTSDGNIKFNKKNTTQTLSIRLIKDFLDGYKEEKQVQIDVEDICDFIVNNLKKTSQIYMNRIIKD